MLFGIGDEAYQRYEFRCEVEKNLREIVTHQKEFVSVQSGVDQANIETLRDGFNELGYSISDLQDTIEWSSNLVAEAICDLEETVSWGLEKISWQQEQTNKLLRDVLKTLRRPLHTRVEELRKRGNEFYNNALKSRRNEDRKRWVDLALASYQEAIKHDPAEFIALYGVGVILFFDKGNSWDALKCFREAAPLAEPYSKRYAAMSLLNLGYVLRNRQALAAAYEATARAVDLDPEWPETQYQHAIHCAMRGLPDETKIHLTRAIEIKASYYPRTISDPDLVPRRYIRELLDHLYRSQNTKAQNSHSSLSRVGRLLRLEILYPLSITYNDQVKEVYDTIDQLDKAKSYTARARAIITAEEIITGSRIMRVLSDIAREPVIYLQEVDPLNSQKQGFSDQIKFLNWCTGVSIRNLAQASKELTEARRRAQSQKSKSVGRDIDLGEQDAHYNEAQVDYSKAMSQQGSNELAYGDVIDLDKLECTLLALSQVAYEKKYGIQK